MASSSRWSPFSSLNGNGTKDDGNSSESGGQLSILKNACQDLKPGQMVFTPGLTLMDAMAAIQILDPRVDGGMQPIPSQLMAPCDRLPENMINSHSRFNINNQLTVNDILWIIDRIQACETSWLKSESLSGASLSQTIHTCLYVHHLSSMHPYAPQGQNNPPPLAKYVLRPYLIGLLKSVGLIWDELIKGNLVDGEDFNGDKAGISLLEDLDPQNALTMLEDASEWVLNASDKLFNQQDQRKQLCDRIDFRKHFLTAVTLFSRIDPNMSFGGISDVSAALQKASSQIQSAEQNLERMYPRNVHSVDLIHAPSSTACSAFDPWFSRHATNIATTYLPNTNQPAQPLQLGKPEEVLKIYKEVLNGMREFIELIGSVKQGWSIWKPFFDHNSISFQQNPIAPYVRSLWQSAICVDHTIALTKPLSYIGQSFLSCMTGLEVDKLQNAIWSNLRSSSSSQNGTQSDRTMSLDKRFIWFIERLSGQLVANLRNLAQNRSRSKRKLGKSYGDLLNLADEASALGKDLCEVIGDQILHPDLFFAAVQTLILDTMLHCILSGLELDLYRHEELLSVYWMAYQISEEQDGVLDALSNWQKGDKDEKIENKTDFIDAQKCLVSALFHASRAFYALYNDEFQNIGKGQLSWLLNEGGEHSSIIKGDIEDEIQQVSFWKRNKWLKIKSRPESVRKAEELWQSFREDVKATHHDNYTVKNRMISAKMDLKASLTWIEKLNQISTKGKQKHFLLFYEKNYQIQQLFETLSNVREAINLALQEPKNFALTTTEPISLLKIENNRKENHPWFPILPIDNSNKS